MTRLATLLFAAALAVGCGGGSGTTLEQGPSVLGFRFTLDSSVDEGQPMAVWFTCDDDNVSPTLAWRGVPEKTKELALVVEDPDAPGGTFTHWLVYALSPEVDSVANGVYPQPEVSTPRYLRQGVNDFGRVGYSGPCPPEGDEHRYVFRLLALRAPSELEPGVERADFDDAIAPIMLAEARMTASYARD